MFLNKNFENLKKVAADNCEKYSSAEPFPSIVLMNFLKPIF